MRESVFLVCVVSVGLVAATASAQPAYYPAGPQRDVPLTTVTSGGWTQCHLDTYADSGADLSDLLDACPGTFMMLACRPNRDENLTLLAAAPRSDVLTDTGENETVTMNSNGSEWYFSEGWGSMGFAMGGDSVDKGSCDLVDTNGDYRLCWHLGIVADPWLGNGYRCGAKDSYPGDLNAGDGWDRIIFVAAEPVPTVSRWHLLVMALMLGAAALASRRMWARRS